jgi:hypothetical protein
LSPRIGGCACSGRTWSCARDVFDRQKRSWPPPGMPNLSLPCWSRQPAEEFTAVFLAWRSRIR